MLEEGQRVFVSGMGAGAGEVKRVDSRGVRVAFDSGSTRTVPADRCKSQGAPKSLTGGEVRAEPITSSAEISGVLPEGPVARAMRGRSAPAARVRQRQPPLECEKYLAWVRKMPCAHCGSGDGVEPHHWSHEGGIMGDKVDDYRVTPLCRACHYDEWHAHGTLPGLDRVASEAFFVATHRALITEWIAVRYANRPEDVVDALVSAIRRLES